MIVASIDIGTNTVLLLIAEVNKELNKLLPLLNEYRMPRIGQETQKTRIINPDKLKLLYEVLNEYDSLIKKYNCDKIIITGTNALRIAKNSTEIADDIKKLFYYELEVISGETEAEYAYLGATSNLNNFLSSIVIDIGGGSSELIYGDESKINFKKSIQIGSVSATEQFLKHSPPLIYEIESLKQEIAILFADQKEIKIPNIVVAIAGTATTLACMNLGFKEFEEDQVENTSININEIKKLIVEMSFLTATEILKKYGPVMEGRGDIILAGAIILSEIMRIIGIEELIVSSRGIRYGAIIYYLDKLNQM